MHDDPVAERRASLRTPSTSPSPASTRRARLRSAFGQAGERVHEVVAALALAQAPEMQELHAACGPARSGTSAGTRTGFGSTTTCDGDISHSFDVEIAPLRRQRDEHVRALQRAVDVAAHGRRQAGDGTGRTPNRARAGSAAGRRAPPSRRGSSCAACCRATRSGCGRWSDRRLAARAAAPAPRARTSTPWRWPSRPPSSPRGACDTYGGR